LYFAVDIRDVCLRGFVGGPLVLQRNVGLKKKKTGRPGDSPSSSHNFFFVVRPLFYAFQAFVCLLR